MKIFIKDEVLYQERDLTVPARPESGIDMRQGPSSSGPKPENIKMRIRKRRRGRHS